MCNRFLSNRYVALVMMGVLIKLPISANACIEPNFDLQDYVVIGQAYANNEIIYRERLAYTTDQEGGQLRTSYTDVDGETIAIKQVDFNCRLSAPDFILEDKVDNKTEGAKHQNGKIITFVDQKEEKLEVPRNRYVVDAGFDHFVRNNWQALIDGKRLTADYLFARDGKFFELRFERADAPNAIKDTDGVVFFKVGADSFLFRLLSSPIYVGYEKETQKLRYYYGPSNVPAMRDYNEVLIVYQHQ